MSAMASHITGVSIVCSTVCSGADQGKHQGSASLAFVRGIHWSLVNSPHKRPVTRKMFPRWRHHGSVTPIRVGCLHLELAYICYFVWMKRKNMSPQQGKYQVWATIHNISFSVQIMVCTQQATNTYLFQCWPRSTTPYGTTRWRLKSPESWLFAQPFVLVEIKENVTGLCEGNPPVTGGFPSQSQ